MPRFATPILSLDVTTYTLRTDAPWVHGDGTAGRQRTILVYVEVVAGGHTGIGYTYADEATAHFIANDLAPVVVGRDAMSISECFEKMTAAARPLGLAGIAANAISAIDIALWDLKARILDVPLVTLLGAARTAVPVYGSGGLTSYPIPRLLDQLGQWVSQGMQAVKMKVGVDPASDLIRVRAVRDLIGPEPQLFVDGGGAGSAKRALAQAERFAELDVSWFEEPVPSDDLDGLRLLRERAPATMEIGSGQMGHEPVYFNRMLAAGAVDVLSADVTRCGGITGFLRVAALCEAHHIPLSAHGAPAITLHVACAVPRLRHIEYAHEHVRLEHRMFEGIPEPEGGMLRPDLSRPGLGLTLKSAGDATEISPDAAYGDH